MIYQTSDFYIINIENNLKWNRKRKSRTIKLQFERNVVFFMKKIKRKISIQTKPVREMDSDYIQYTILSGEYKQGKYIIERGLDDNLGISTTPVKEALRQLEYEGIVVTINRKGTMVSNNLMNSWEEINYARSAIEGVAAGLASLKSTNDEIEELEGIIKKIKYFTNQENKDEILKLNMQFHEKIKKFSKNTYIAKQIDAVRSFDKHFRERALSQEGELKYAYEEHSFILEKIKTKNYNEAEKAMRDHIRDTNNRVI